MQMNFTKFIKPKTIIIVILVLVIAGGSFVFWQVKQGKINLPVLPISARGNKLGAEAIDFINKNLLAPGTTASLISITNEGSVYKIKLKIGDQEPEVYVSKDGKFLFTAAFKIEKAEVSASPSPSQEIPRAEKPNVKLFVMSYCPYGLQMEKAYLPVYQLLKNKVDFEIDFVDYIMHKKQELDENLRQYCIQDQNKEEFAKYLDCFAKTGKIDSCLNQTSINQAKLSTCIVNTDDQFKITSQYNDKSTWVNGQYPKFDIHKDLNEQYSVQGSPTVIINEKIVSTSERSPEAFKNLVCQSFNNPPEECSQTLSTNTPAAGIGSGTGSSNSGSCE